MIGGVVLEPGTRVDGWQITRALRAGGFGAVYQAEQNGKPFALKVALHREDSGDTGKTHARALRELVVLLMMDHPNIIKPRGYGYLPDGRVYCVFEYVDGWTLGEWLERTHPTFREIASVFAQISGAVAYMHERGVLHRDLKLSNVMVRRSGEPVIIDLGCASYENAEELTTTPLPPGTEHYRSPEAQEFLHKQGRKPGARYPFKVADELYAVGVMLYELLTEPLPTKAPLDALKPRVEGPLARLRSAREANPQVPEALSALVEDLLARAPAQRPEDFEALRRRLEELASQPGPEYAAAAHPPSMQRPALPGAGGPPAGLAAPGKQGGRKPWVFTGMLAAVVLAAAVTAWLARGGPSVPALQPVSPPVTSMPESSPVPAPAPDSVPAAPATAPKEGSHVKPKPTDAPQSPRTAGAPKTALAAAAPGSPAWCKAVPLAVALAHAGCASAQLKAEPFECPPGAVEAMEKLGWHAGESFYVRLDERGPSHGAFTFTLGAPLIGRVDDRETGQTLAPPRTLFYGRLYLTEKTEDHPLGRLVAVYDHVEIPNVGKFPVCAVSLEVPIRELKDGTATAQVNVAVYPAWSWRPQRY
jgi:predicted Ser/Thr protein kinase